MKVIAGVRRCCRHCYGMKKFGCEGCKIGFMPKICQENGINNTFCQEIEA